MASSENRLEEALAGRYAVGRKLGAGGMATVYLAEDVRHRRNVAIKVFHPELAATLGPGRFLREIEIAAQLQHPHILPLYDSGEVDGLFYYVMPLVDGETLRQKIAREGPLSVSEAAHILREIADALGHAHDHHVVHRDLKPDNVMLSGRHVLVADFGIAKALSEATGRQHVTTAGIAVGTPAYMAPEQAAADPDIDHRVDIYAFGTVAYECLTGGPPFTGSPQAVLAAQVTVSAEPVSSRRDGLPPDLAALVMDCLAKDRSARPARFDDVLHRLESAVTPSGGMPSTVGPAVPRGPGTTSIAVLPFTNMSADPDNEYFADGMTEEIINALSQVESLQVVSRTSAFAFKATDQDIRKIGSQLNVGTVLEGSVRQAGNRIRVTAQLVKVEDGYHLWSERFDRGMEDVFAVQDEIAAAITEALTERLVPTSPTIRKRAVDVEAYKLYLKGRFQWNKRTNETMRTAIQLFEQALERDASYAPAYAGIADCYGLLGWVAFGALPPHDAFPKAEAAARKALALDDTLAEAHNTLGWTRLVYGWDASEAEREFQRAIELNPRYAMGHSWYGLHLAWTGRLEEGVGQGAQAMELDPLSLIIHTLAAWVLYFGGQYEESIELYTKALELDPHYIRAHLGLGWVHEQTGAYDQAIERFNTAHRLSGGAARMLGALGHAYAIAGDTARAEEYLSALLDASETTFVSPAYVASVYAGLGDADQTFAWLEKALETRAGSLVYLSQDPQLAAFRDDPRFASLEARVGLPT